LKTYWTEPDNGGSQITNYYVQIQDKNNSWRDVIGCGINSNVCITPFSELRSSYNLEIDDSIQIRIIAENAKGSGAVSNTYTSPIPVLGEPNRM
jgi:hypothetical protein